MAAATEPSPRQGMAYALAHDVADAEDVIRLSFRAVRSALVSDDENATGRYHVLNLLEQACLQAIHKTAERIRAELVTGPHSGLDDA